MVATKSGVRLIASIDNADYWPVIAKWNGAGFSKPVPTGDKNACAPSSHDLNTDASGRLVDVSEECSNVTIANLPATTVAGLFSFKSGGTFAGGIPQIASTPRGHADRGLVDRVHRWRPALLQPGAVAGGPLVGEQADRRRPSDPDRSDVVPAGVDHHVAVKGRREPGLKAVVGATMGFGGKKLGARATIDGAKSARPTRSTRLTGRVVFGKGACTQRRHEALKFRSCINP